MTVPNDPTGTKTVMMPPASMVVRTRWPKRNVVASPAVKLVYAASAKRAGRRWRVAL